MFAYKNTNAGVMVTGGIFILVSLLFSESAMSRSAGNPASLIYGYQNCTWQENGGNSITVSVDVAYKKSLPRFMTHAFMMWIYDSDGTSHPLGSPSYPVDLQLDGTAFAEKRANQYGVPADNVMMWGVGGAWKFAEATTFRVTATFSGKPGQAVSLLAADMFLGGSVLGYWGMYEEMGAAYLYPGLQGAGCQVVPPINPPKPPKPSISLITVAPDWNLGELPPQHGEKKFTAMSDQLCFYYSDPAAVTLNLVLDADSQNGVVGGQYQLKDLDDPTQVVPYSLVLNDGSDEVVLPNLGKSGIRLNPLNPTCFAPTFRTFVAPYLKPGYYSDVLTFTIVTKT